MTIRQAERGEVAALTALSRAAFATDAEVGAPQAGGPPAYDNEPWHEEMRRQGHLYSALDGEKLVGGLLLFRDEKAAERLYVGRIFLDPAVHGQGLGLAMMRAAEAAFPDVTCWRLDTPVWNRRTNRFYRKLGYVETGRNAEEVFFEKRIEAAASPA